MRLLLDHGGELSEIAVTAKALDQVRAAFNPSANSSVDRAKLLGAALITEADHAASSPEAGNEERRLAAIARTHIEIGAMFIVKALTTPKPLEPAVDPAAPTLQGSGDQAAANQQGQVGG